MDVIVQRSGGLAGLRLTWQVEVDAQPDRDDWVLLLDELPWHEVPAAPPEPDRYVYRISCPPNEVELAERQLTGPWQQLVERVRRTAAPQRGGAPRRPGR
ncbi:protealysin inhibitor emfourin [Agromyces soli]|uniref:Uncharacterized protein n=1 Tax=Agromyces soli TaxID=659012 RepID=A0ABY4AVH3_9MICO|nr:protealysin inhibitor emfourin [Agromyces soli]UOE25833.1 hypothetical protein MTP13_16175 [Agromyces soli]